jgi:SAM-dependent methyltransferase/uncharacterized protein YbaR (Trm112 family)
MIFNMPNGETPFQQLLPHFVCPTCGGELSLERFDDNNGIFICLGSCESMWPLFNGIPRFVDSELYEDEISYHRYVGEFNTELSELGATSGKTGSDASPHNVSSEKNTNDYFGHSWKEGSDWGWIEEDEIPEGDELRYEGGTVNSTESAWNSKALLSEDDIAPENFVLDAGCGNGRFSKMAAKRGATVVSVDLGTKTVEAAADNLKEHSNIQVIQADLLQLPFESELFQTGFSIGVLHHTGNAKRAFQSIASCIKKGGVLAITVYHKLNPLWMIINRILRSYTTKLSVQHGELFARGMAGLARIIKRIHPRLLDVINLFLRLQPTERHMFDWYSAPVASFHTYPEIEEWFLENNFSLINMNKSPNYHNRMVIEPWAATVKGIKSEKARNVRPVRYFE